MAEEIAGSPLEIRQVAERALVLQRYLLRRAWGVGYAAWSVWLFWAVFGSLISAWLRISVDGRVLVGVLASGAALAVTLRAFRRVRDTVKIRNQLIEGRWRRIFGFRLLVPAWVATFAITALLVFAFRLSDFLLAVYVLSVYVALWAFLYYALRLSFYRRLPGEGIAVLLSLGAATVGSITVLALGLNDAVIGILWGMTLVTWVASAVYTRRLTIPTSEATLSG